MPGSPVKRPMKRYSRFIPHRDERPDEHPRKVRAFTASVRVSDRLFESIRTHSYFAQLVHTTRTRNARSARHAGCRARPVLQLSPPPPAGSARSNRKCSLVAPRAMPAHWAPQTGSNAEYASGSDKSSSNVSPHEAAHENGEAKVASLPPSR